MKDGVVYTDSVKTAGKTADAKVEKVLAANSDEDIELYMRSQVLMEREGSTLQPLKRYLSNLGGGKARVFVKAHGEVKLSAEIIK